MLNKIRCSINRNTATSALLMSRMWDCAEFREWFRGRPFIPRNTEMLLSPRNILILSIVIMSNICWLKMRAENVHPVARKQSITKHVLWWKTLMLVYFFTEMLWFAFKNTVKLKNKLIFIYFSCVVFFLYT